MDATAENADNGNGLALQNICIEHDMIPMNTARRNPRQTEHDPYEAATWSSPDGKTRRVAISRKTLPSG